ncbi:MAG TPA: DUF4157 domain-containing protein [Candidatus Angelobacter sp.]
MNVSEQIPAKENRRFATAYPAFSGPVLRRACACGKTSGSGGECEECKKKKLQRRAAGDGGPLAVPPIVHDVLKSAGQPLDHESRSLFEPRFGHSFGNVRVHADDKAAQSARAVNALAYTAGHNVVFNSGQFAPRTAAGQKLLAHELTHVVQQQANSATQMPQLIGEAHDASEREADLTAETATSKAASGLGRGSVERPMIAGQSRPVLRRKLIVDRPSATVPNGPNAAPNTPQKTNAQVVEDYIRTLASGSNAEVDKSSGEVSVATAYCPGILGGAVRGASFGYDVGAAVGLHIPGLSHALGFVGGVIGGLVGGVLGLFGSSVSKAASSSTSTGATCICDMLDTSSPWVIEINDTDHPRTMGNPGAPGKHSQRGGRVRVPSPNSPTIWGAANVAGQLENDPPWLILGHELCGHAWLEEKHKEDAGAGLVPSVVRNAQTGQLELTSPELLSGNTVAPHGDLGPIQRENLLRREHGMSARGFRVRDPYCGESFSRTTPQGTPQFTEGEDPSLTNMQQCEFLRSQLPENKDGRYRIDQQIPEPQGGSH